MDIQTVTASIQALVAEQVAAGIAADDAADEPVIQARIVAAVTDAMAKDAAQDAARDAALMAQIAQLTTDLADCRGHTDPPPPPPPPPTTTTFPDASNTGVPKGTVLKASGSVTTTKDGQIIEGLDISGSVTIKHANVVMRKSKLTSSSFLALTCRSGKNFVMEDCEVIGVGTEGASGIDGYGKFYRLNVHGFENDFNVTGGGGAGGGIYDCYLWGLSAKGAPHYDTIQIDGDVANFEILRSTVINEFKQTSAIMIDNYFGSIKNIVVDHCRLLGGGFTVYSDGQFSGGSISGVKITNCRMGRGGYDYFTSRNNTVVFTGNVDDVTGRPL